MLIQRKFLKAKTAMVMYFQGSVQIRMCVPAIIETYP